MGQSFTLPAYQNGEQSGEHTFTVDSHKGNEATVTSETGGTFTMPISSVKHFHDDLNRRVDVPEHPSHPGINAVRQGQAAFLGKGNDGIVFDTNDGNVAKVTTSVPHNLAYFRPHGHAISDARKQAELNNQAISEGHDLLLPQEFIEHGEKGFTIMPKLQIGGELSKEQIMAYREKLQAFHDAGWRLNDDVQHGVDAEGNIRIFDTGALEKIGPGADETSYAESQREHGDALLRQHGHFDDVQAENKLRDLLRQLRGPSSFVDAATQWQEMVDNGHDALPFLIDEAREALQPHQGNEMAARFEDLLASYESEEANKLLDERMLKSQEAFKSYLESYGEYDGQSVDDYIQDKDLFAEMVVELDADEIASIAMASHNSGLSTDAIIAGFAVDLDDDMQPYLDLQIEKTGIGADGEEVEPGTPLSDGSPYEPQDEPDMDEYMRNQYPEGYSWYESGFLMQDGTLLDMSYGSGQRADDHRNISPSEQAANRWGWDIDGSQWSLLQNTMQRSGAFRIDGGAGLLHMETKPTREQERAIAEYINENDPDYLAISFQGKDWGVDNPNAGQVLRQIEQVAHGQEIYQGEFTDEHINNFDAWLEEATEAGDVQENEDIDWYDGIEKYITADGSNATSLAESDVGFLDKLIAMNPGVNLDGDTVTIVGMPTGEQLLSIATWIDENAMEAMSLAVYDKNGNEIVDEEFSEQDDYLDGTDVADQIEKALQTRTINAENRKENLKKWAKGSKLVHEDGSPLVLYHGSARPDRIGDRFRKDRATSGPMPFFTTNPEVASGYAVNKSDTSLDYDETELYDRFTIDGVPLLDAWDRLSPQDKQNLSDNLHKVYWNSETDKYELDETGGEAPLDEKQLKESANNPHYMSYGDKRIRKGNLLAALYDYWMHGGLLHPHTEYKNLRNILHAAGIGLSRTNYDDPYASYGAVFPVHIRMENPLHSNDVPKEVADAVTEAAEQAAIDWENTAESDLWDKNSKEPREWAELFEQATQDSQHKNDNSYIWTSIPDFASNVFRRLGYDGIIDLGNKGGGGMAHEVVIPFEENQVKSATGNVGTFDDRDNRMTYAAEDGTTNPLYESFLERRKAGISKPKTYEYPDTGEHQKIAPSHKQKQTQQSYEESKKSQDVAIDAKNLEPYKYEEPASPPEPNQDARNQLRKAYEETTGEEAPKKSSTIAERMRQNRKLYDESDDSGKQLWANYANIDMKKIDELHQSAHPHLFDYVTGHEDDEYLYHVTPSINAEAIGKEGLRANQDQVAAAEANRHDIAGNVYLSEKSDLSKWMDYFHNVQIDSAGDMAYIKQEELDELSEQLLQHEPGSEEHATIQSQIESVQSEKEHYEKLEIAESYDDTVSVFRVPKKSVQNYLTKDTGPQGADGAYKLNQHVQKMTKQSIELKGKFDRELINTSNDFRYLAEKRDELRAKVKKSEMLASDAQQESLRSANDAYEKDRYDTEFIVEVEKAISNLKDWRYGKRPGTFNNILEPWMSSSDNYKRYAAMDYSVFVRLANEHTEDTSDLELYMDAHGKQMQSQLVDIAKAQVENMKLEVATNPNYWRWNRGGVALDDNGLPLVIFHGTWRGGFDEFGKSDVGTQVWGSTNVRMASSYAGGYRDDASPTIAGDIAEMRSMIATAARYTIGPHEDGEIYFSEIGAPGGKTKPILKAADYDEMLVKFNNWLLDQKEPTHGLNKRGVYPLVYRLENPLTFDAGGEKWNEIYAIPEYDDYVTGDFLAKYPGTRILLDNMGNDQTPSQDAVHQKVLDYLWDRKSDFEAVNFIEKRNEMGAAISKLQKLETRSYASVLDILMDAMPDLDVDRIFWDVLESETVIRTRDLADYAEKQGHDGVIIKSVVDYGGELDSSEFDDQSEEEIYTPNDVYVAFQYDQVKSAHNRKAFSESPDEAKRLSYQATA